MPATKPIRRKRIRSILIWLLLATLFQFTLMNISAALYASKLTHLQMPDKDTWAKPVSNNIFARTWRHFTGPTFYKQPLNVVPDFPFEVVTLVTADSLRLETWYAKTDSVAKGTAVLFHGLMGHKGLVLAEARAFRQLGYHVLLVDARCHGNSEGPVTTIGFKEAADVKAAYEWVQAQGEKRIFLCGFSLGAVEVIKAVADYGLQPAGIVAEAPFLSLQTHLKGKARLLGFPQQPFGFLTSFWIGVQNGFYGWGFQVDKYAANLRCPVLLQYGARDPLVLQSELDAIYAALPPAHKSLEIYEEAAHESLLGVEPAHWMKAVGDFLKTH